MRTILMLYIYIYVLIDRPVQRTRLTTISLLCCSCLIAVRGSINGLFRIATYPGICRVFGYSRGFEEKLDVLEEEEQVIWILELFGGDEKKLKERVSMYTFLSSTNKN